MKQFIISQKKVLGMTRKTGNTPRSTLVFKNKARYSRKEKHKGGNSND
jgi:hypothetical protein